MGPRRGDKLAWGIAMVAAVIVVIVMLMNGDALERAFSGSDHGARPTSGDGGRPEMR